MIFCFFKPTSSSFNRDTTKDFLLLTKSDVSRSSGNVRIIDNVVDNKSINKLKTNITFK